jgi:hypothetical protein
MSRRSVNLSNFKSGRRGFTSTSRTASRTAGRGLPRRRHAAPHAALCRAAAHRAAERCGAGRSRGAATHRSTAPRCGETQNNHMTGLQVFTEVLTGKSAARCARFEFRAVENGARIRNLRAESSRNQVLDPNLVHKHAISRAGVGDHFRKSFRCRLECGVVPSWDVHGPLCEMQYVK